MVLSLTYYPWNFCVSSKPVNALDLTSDQQLTYDKKLEAKSSKVQSCSKVFKVATTLGEREQKNELLGRQLVQLERGQELVSEAERGLVKIRLGPRIHRMNKSPTVSHPRGTHFFFRIHDSELNSVFDVELRWIRLEHVAGGYLRELPAPQGASSPERYAAS